MTDSLRSPDAPAWTLENVEDEYTDYILWLPDTAGHGGRLRLTIDSAKRVAFCALTLDTMDGEERGELTGNVSLDWALAIAHAVNGYTLPPAPEPLS